MPFFTFVLSVISIRTLVGVTFAPEYIKELVDKAGLLTGDLQHRISKRFVIDTAAFAAGDAEYWTSWTLFFTDGERVPVAGETATLDVVGLADGVLESATVTFFPSGESMSYTLNDWSETPLIVTLD